MGLWAEGRTRSSVAASVAPLVERSRPLDSSEGGDSRLPSPLLPPGRRKDVELGSSEKFRVLCNYAHPEIFSVRLELLGAARAGALHADETQPLFT